MGEDMFQTGRHGIGDMKHKKGHKDNEETLVMVRLNTWERIEIITKDWNIAWWKTNIDYTKTNTFLCNENDEKKKGNPRAWTGTVRRYKIGEKEHKRE